MIDHHPKRNLGTFLVMLRVEDSSDKAGHEKYQQHSRKDLGLKPTKQNIPPL